VTQVYNGIDTETYAPGSAMALRKALDLPAGAPVVGTVGRLDPIKDHRTLLEAFDAVRRRRPRARLLVVGDGAERRLLESAAGEGVRFLGTRPDVPELLRVMDVFVLPSINEGISNTLLEAMASGLPVIATRAGGNPELVDHQRTGLLTPVGDARALAEAIGRYLSDGELRAAHGREARKEAVQRFGGEGMVKAYERVYRRVALCG
jgi:glycosyltransferase involved in cell wall biosynthesis